MDDTRLIELAGLAAGEKYDLANRNPLERDDLALRLAVKIKQLISINDENTFAAAQIENMSRLNRNGLQHIEHGKDPYAATRRAIVRAAAEIGQHSAPSKEEL